MGTDALAAIAFAPMPGTLQASQDTSLSTHLQFAKAATAAGKSWAGNAVAAVVSGGLGSLQLAHAESAAQQMLATRCPQSLSPDPQKPYNTRRQAANILLGASQSLTPLVARSLAKKGLAGPLLQVRHPMLLLMSCGLEECRSSCELLLVGLMQVTCASCCRSAR